jgi:hypothetical protein
LPGLTCLVLVLEEFTLELERIAGIRKSVTQLDKLCIEERSIRQIQIHQLPVMGIGPLFAESYGNVLPIEALARELCRFTSEVLNRIIGSNTLRSINTN